MSVVITPPSESAVPLDVVADHVRLDDDAPDLALVATYLAAATAHVEDHMGRAIITQTVEDIFDDWPCGDFCMPQPFQAVDQITYVDINGALQTLDASKYITVPEWGIISRAHKTSWPAARRQRGAVRVRTVVGFGDDWNAVPADIQQAILLLVGHYYENRELVATGTIMNRLPYGIEALLARYRMIRGF